MAAEPQFSIVCLSSQEWATPLPTNRQQIMRRAAAQGHRVLFVETGEFLGRHLRRLATGPNRTSLARRLVTGERVAPGVTVRKALNVLPWGQRFAFCNRVNGRVSRLALRHAGRALPAPRVTWLYDPRATWAIGAFGDAFGVYDCVDDYAEQTAGARNRALVAAADRQAAAAARIVFTTTESLRARHLPTNSNTHLARNVADYGHFATAVRRETAAPEVAGLPRPVLGFAGAITSVKIDFDLLHALADASSDRTILLVGPAEPSAVDPLERLLAHENVVWAGPAPYDDLPRRVAAFDVGLIPYVESDYTRAVFPLKLFEYLAAGKPVVATGVPEIAGLEPDAVLAGDHAEVEAALARALEITTEADVARRQAIASRNTWEDRTARLLSLVAAELAT